MFDPTRREGESLEYYHARLAIVDPSHLSPGEALARAQLLRFARELIEHEGGFLGPVLPPPTPLEAACLTFASLTVQERLQFLSWIEGQGCQGTSRT